MHFIGLLCGLLGAITVEVSCSSSNPYFGSNQKKARVPSHFGKAGNNSELDFPWQLSALDGFITRRTPAESESEEVIIKERLFQHKIRLPLLGNLHISPKKIRMYAQLSAFAGLGVFAFRLIGRWYKGVAEYELLLDSADSEYHKYGCSLTDIGGDLLQDWRSQEDLDEGLQFVRQFLDTTLRASCFPRKYLEYAQAVGRDASKAVAELDKVDRLSRRRKRLSAADDFVDTQREERELLLRVQLQRWYFKSPVVFVRW
jgi:hypothetical protein